MNYKVRVGAGGAMVTLTDRHYKASGGEAAIYVNGHTAFKIFHEPKQKMPPPRKLDELSKIQDLRVVIPQEIIYDAATAEPLGYTTPYIDDAYPLARFFTRTFKDDNNVDPAMVAELVKRKQQIVAAVHAAQCLVVDLNELNVLVKIESQLEPWFIDTNSYATPSFRATAIMDSVRDRRVSQVKGDKVYYNPDPLSDWFSWGVLAFWLYTNIHPFRGNYPGYKDKTRQMDDGISVFHRGVRVPPSVNDFNIIPRRHLEWFKAVFLRNERSIPPLADTSAPIAMPAATVTISSTDKMTVTQIAAYPGTVLSVFCLMGTNYAVTRDAVCFGKREVPHPMKSKKVALAVASNGTIITANLWGGKVHFFDLNRGTEIGTISGTDLLARNEAIYTVANGRLIESSFSEIGNKVVHLVKEIENVSSFTATTCEGCIIQDLLGKKYLTVPYARGRSFSKYLPQLDGFRVIDAKSEKTVTVILAERGGMYHRFIIMFRLDYSDFQVREIKDVAYDAINFTVLENIGHNVCLLLASPTELEIFASPAQCETLSDPPFDSTMRLFSTPDGAFFINGNSIHQIQRK